MSQETEYNGAANMKKLKRACRWTSSERGGLLCTLCPEFHRVHLPEQPSHRPLQQGRERAHTSHSGDRKKILC